MNALPAWTWLVMIIGVVGMLGLLVLGLPRHRRGEAAVVIGLWVALTSTLAAHGAFAQSADTTVPWIGPVILVALALSLVGLRTSTVGELAALTRGQAFRVVGGVFVVLMLLGHLPPQFAIPAGLGDVAVGLTAPFIARRLARGDTRGAWTFHVLGIVDLVVALATGFLSAPGPYRLFDGSVSTYPITQLPLVLVPVVLVPLAIGVHLTVLRTIATARRAVPVSAPVRIA